MTQPVKQEDEFFPTGGTSKPESHPKNDVFRLKHGNDRPATLKEFITLDELIESFSSEPGFEEEMAEANKELASLLYADEPGSFSALRMRAGLSQRKLAERSETSQSHIARIELGQLDPGTDTIARLAAALGVDEATAFMAVRHQRKTRGGV